MKKFLVGVLAFCMGAMNPSIASSPTDLEEMIAKQVATLDGAISQAKVDPSPSTEDWHLNVFWLRVRLPVGFEVPGFATLQIVPELELLWKRDLPDGDSLYHP